ncbi:hypothetical protein [Phormidium sp. CCY1219]|nr:hypothetical protein [Phormidium sp. CCY1219]
MASLLAIGDRENSRQQKRKTEALLAGKESLAIASTPRNERTIG